MHRIIRRAHVFEGARITRCRDVVARDAPGRRRALASPPMQRRLRGIFEAMNEFRLRFASSTAAPRFSSARLRREQVLGARSNSRVRSCRIVESLLNEPFLGIALRLGITFPEITEMQGRAIFRSASRSRRGIDVKPEIMIPPSRVSPSRQSARHTRGDCQASSGAWARTFMMIGR